MNNVSIDIKGISLKRLQSDNNFQPNIDAEMVLEGKEYFVKFNGDIITIVSKGIKPAVLELPKTTKRYITDVLSAYIAGITNRTQLSFRNEEDVCENRSCTLEE